MASTQSEQRCRKPMYEDEHTSCSVLLARIRNEGHLLCLPPHHQFRWLHRFYLVLDRIAEQHRVYKLYGGPHGFMISTGVAEPDADHASTLLRFAVHLLQAVQSIRLSGSVPLDLVMVLASGPAMSGLLGTTSLTYQIVGRSVSVARELMDTQMHLPFIVTSGMVRELSASVAGELLPMGNVKLMCCPGEEEAVYSLPRYAGVQLNQPALELDVGPGAGGNMQLTKQYSSQQQLPADTSSSAGPAAAAAAHVQAHQQQPGRPQDRTPTVQAAAGPALPPAAPKARWAPAAEASAACDCDAVKSRGGSKGEARMHAAAASGGSAADPVAASVAATEAKMQLPPRFHLSDLEGSLPYNQSSCEPGLAADLLMRFEDPKLEAAFARYNGEMQAPGEMAWLVLSLLTTLLYLCSWVHPSLPPARILLFQMLPVLGAVMSHFYRDAYLRYREGLWFMQRMVVLVATSLPGSCLFPPAGASPLFAFGMCNLSIEAITRRMRVPLQLLSSLVVHAITLSCMSLHPEGSPGRALITPSFLSLHLAVTALAPVLVAASADYLTRTSFQSQVRRLGLDAVLSSTKLKLH